VLPSHAIFDFNKADAKKIGFCDSNTSKVNPHARLAAEKTATDSNETVRSAVVKKIYRRRGMLTYRKLLSTLLPSITMQ
jgi:hypothetical protein